MADMEIINGMEVETLARSLYDARSKRATPMDDERWARVKRNFPGSVEILMDEAREIAMEDE